MSIIVFVFAVLLIICCLVVIAEEPGLSVFGSLAVAALFFGIPYVSLNYDVNLAIAEKQYIELEEEYIADLREQLDSFPKFDAALMNNDTPVAAITQSLHDAQKTLRERKVSILDAKRDIAARRTGLTAYIFWFYSEETLKMAE